jgi:hypothetical protein
VEYLSKDVEVAITPADLEEFSKVRDENIVLGVSIGLEIDVRSRSFYQSLSEKIPPPTRGSC